MVRAFAERITDFKVPTSVLDYQAHNTATHHQTRRFGPFTGKRFWGCYTILELSRFFLSRFWKWYDFSTYSRIPWIFQMQLHLFWQPFHLDLGLFATVTYQLCKYFGHFRSSTSDASTSDSDITAACVQLSWPCSCLHDPSSILHPSCCLS